MRLRFELDANRGKLEHRIADIQQDITERMTRWRELPAPDLDDTADGSAMDDGGE